MSFVTCFMSLFFLSSVAFAETNQSSRPKLLPILGDESAGEIGLSIASSGRPNVFSLAGKELRLTAPLDRDHQDISSVILQVYSSHDCFPS